MKKPEWYRRTTWTPDDKADFEAHLKRSRTSFHKAQYLRIQAVHLQQVGTDSMLHAAMELLDRMIRDYPEASQLSSAWQQRGQCLVDLGRHHDAIEAFARLCRPSGRRPGGGTRRTSTLASSSFNFGNASCILRQYRR